MPHFLIVKDRVGAMSDKEQETLEPLAISIEEAVRVSGESKSRLYELIGDRQIEARKSGRRTLVVFASLKQRLGNLPLVEIKRKRRST
jgi:hypothetical protein